MKKFYTILSLLFLSSALISQTFVSTVAENKNVVLEEFTGIHCGYCPDGHVVANGISNNNPGDVVLVNIHVGTYAEPNTGEPDFRTPWGDAIKNQAGVSGYPAGSINRHDFTSQGWSQNGGTAMSRGDWDDASAEILSNSSYVNVAAQSSIDISTRELTVNVEAYFTGNGTGADKLNIFLLQNNVEGPQSNGATYNPSAILPNGNYNHQHMLRHLVTGQWGDDIMTTSQGTFFSNTYTYTIPNDLNGVAYDLFNMEVVVFVADGQQEIISGNKSSMSFIIPAGISLTDLEATTNMTMPADYCIDSVTPEITITNNSAVVVDTFDVSYTLNSNNPVSQTIYSTLAPQASTTITFTSIGLPYGSNNIYYDVNLDNSTTLIDSISGNNYTSSGEFNTISSVAFAQNHDEGFESYSTGSSNLNNAIIENPFNENTYVVSNSVSSSATQNLGGFGYSDKSYRMRFYTWSPGNDASIIFENLDFSTTTGNNLIFSHAYAQYSNENDQLEVLVSTDCGNNWSSVFDKSGSALATANPFSTGHYYPQITEWASNDVDLSAFDGESNVMLSFKGTSDYGNNLYIDDINVGPNVVSIDVESSNNIVRLYPNPIDRAGTIEFNLENPATISYEIFDLLGKKVSKIIHQNLVSGTHTYMIDSEQLENGTYFIKYKINDVESAIQFIVSH